MRPFEAPDPTGSAEPCKTPAFSVVIPAYNAAATIGEAVESALTQTLRAREVIVCDDGSTDGLETALQEYRDQITLVQKENGGEGSAKDAGSRTATGDFVVILDADDAFLPERLEALAELAQARSDLDILTTDAFLEADREVVRRAYGAEWGFEVENQRRGILERNFIFGAAAIRRDRLLAVGSFDVALRYAADWDLWIRLILSGSSAGLVAEPLYRYRIGPNALSAHRPALVRGFVTVLERASARLDLSADERLAVKRSLDVRRRELALLELDDALDGGSGRVRRRAAAVLGRRRVRPRARLKALAALVAPGLAAGFHARRRAQSWVGAGGTLVAALPSRRLVAYSDAEDLGGAEVSLGHLLAGLDARYKVTVVGVHERVVAYLAARRPTAASYVLRPVRRKYDLRDVFEHLRTFRRLRADVVHVSMKTPWACPYALLGAYLARARIVLVEQSLFPEDRWLRRAVSRFGARHAAAVVAVGDRSAREIERLLSLEPGSVRTIRNGVPNRSYGPSPERGRVIGSLGRLDAEKGYETLVRALPRLDATAILVGDGPDRERLQQLAATLGVSDRFVVTGWADDARAHLTSFSVFCLPSRSESFPLTVVEAMVAGLPVVATDVGSVREAVRDGETGFLVARDDPVALANALRRLLDDPELRAEMGRRARELALERFTADRMAENFERLYEEVLA
jgi:glycosyltransferase involved in cell wall biosynthesis